MKKIKTFEDKILELRSLERKINKAYTRAINNALFIESKRGAIFYEKWCGLIKELRGWDNPNYDQKTNPEFIKSCKKEKIAYTYNFGDVCA